MNSLCAEFVASLLKGFFYQKAHSFQRSACLLHQIQNAERGVAIGQEVIDKEYSILRAEEFAAHAYGVVLSFGEGMDGGAEHVLHGAGFLFLGKNHRDFQQVTYHDGGGNAAGFYGDDLVDAGRGKTTDEFDCHGTHEAGIHLVIDKTVYFQNATGETLAISENSFFERFHNDIQPCQSALGEYHFLLCSASIITRMEQGAHMCPKCLGHVRGGVCE